MENNKSKKVLGILSIMWSTILLIYQIIRNTLLSDWYSDAYMKQVLTYGTESAQQFKLGFETMNNLLSIAFLVCLIVIVIFIIIYHKKRNIKIFSKEAISNGTIYILLGLLLYILLGWNLISLIIVTIGGFLFYKQQLLFRIESFIYLKN